MNDSQPMSILFPSQNMLTHSVQTYRNFLRVTQWRVIFIIHDDEKWKVLSLFCGWATFSWGVV